MLVIDGGSWRPTVADVARTIRARTYVDGNDAADPLDDVVGGSLAGTFTEATSPSAAQVEGHIDDACIDVLGHFAGGEIPEASYDAAKRAVALKAALAIEVSKFDEGAAEASPYLQLRIDADQALTSLLNTAQTRDLFAEEAPK